MSMDYYVAVHAADWRSPAALNRCMGELGYPVRIATDPATGVDGVPGPAAGNQALLVLLKGKPVEMEAEVTRLGPESPYALHPRPGIPTRIVTLPDGSSAAVQVLGGDDYVPADLNADLREIGVPSPDYRDGDYVVSVTFHGTAREHQAGALLMAGLIRCASGLGFEFQGPSHGRIDFADALVREVADGHRK